ncbi:HipA N-terminal domain-containing protein [Pedobacter jamesrossensis]|uniref:HipA N-terminal domain-containing protein n=1 Tax=Pedobacter jamesrossensis TaxID=1908238 RepID=A0ABV8NJL5_9SPHI
MRTAKILFKGEEAGILMQYDDGAFEFHYHDRWVNDDNKPPISLTLPKSLRAYHSRFLFPFFYNMLPEGTNKQVVCQLNRIDQKDYFGLLLNTAKYDTIGAVTVIKIEQE